MNGFSIYRQMGHALKFEDSQHLYFCVVIRYRERFWETGADILIETRPSQTHVDF